MAFSGIVFDVAASTQSFYDGDGFLQVQHDAYGGRGTEPMFLYHQYGFFSRPRDPATDDEGNPIASEACSLLVGQDGDDAYAMVWNDPRFMGIIPAVGKGGACFYAVTDEEKASFYVVDGDDGTHTVYVPIGDSAHAVQIGRDANGDALITITHADGQAIRLFDGGITLTSPGGNAYIEIRDGKITLNGDVTVTGSVAVQGQVAAQQAITSSQIAAGVPGQNVGIPVATVAELNAQVNGTLIPLINAAIAGATAVPPVPAPVVPGVFSVIGSSSLKG